MTHWKKFPSFTLFGRKRRVNSESLVGEFPFAFVCNRTLLRVDALQFTIICRRDRAAVMREMARRGKRTPARTVPHGRRRQRRWRHHRCRSRSFRGRRIYQWHVPPPMSRWIYNSDDDGNRNHKTYLWRRRRQSPRPHRPSTTKPSSPRASCLCRLRQSDHRRATFRPARHLYRNRRWRVSRDLKCPIQFDHKFDLFHIK